MIDSILNIIPQLLSSITEVQLGLNWYAYEFPKCSYAYSMNVKFSSYHDWPRLTQSKRQYEDKVLTKGWKLNSIRNAFRNILEEIDVDGKAAFILFISMPNVEDHDRWMMNNVPMELIKQIVSKGHVVFLICIRENGIKFNAINRGDGTGGFGWDDAGEEYGLEKKIESINSCLTNSSTDQYSSLVMKNKQDMMHNMLVSDKCTVQVRRTAFSEDLLNNVDESISFLCRDVIEEGSICNLAEKKFEQKKQVLAQETKPKEFQRPQENKAPISQDPSEKITKRLYPAYSEMPTTFGLRLNDTKKSRRTDPFRTGYMEEKSWGPHFWSQNNGLMPYSRQSIETFTDDNGQRDYQPKSQFASDASTSHKSRKNYIDQNEYRTNGAPRNYGRYWNPGFYGLI